ncbi:MAG: OadG family protein [Rikenellaceae bacterium]
MEKVFKKLLLTFLLVFVLGSGLMAAEAAAPASAHATTVQKDTPNHERILESDPYGIGLAVTSMSVVFSSLFLLYVVFRSIGMIMMWNEKRRKKSVAKHIEHHNEDAKSVFSGEIAAAITLAIQMYENDMHDKESTVLTINRVAKAYSPWNSKIHGLRQSPYIKK